MTYLLVFISLVVVSVVYLKLADHFNIVDKPNQRSSHTVPTIRGGGVLFVFAVLIFFGVSGLQYPYFIAGTILIALVSFVDDLKTLSSRVRLPFQFLAIYLLLFEVFGFDAHWLYFLLFGIVGVGFINMYNFMDGINGITGLFSFTILTGLYFVNLKNPVINPDLFRFVMMSIAVFGYYNFRKKARFFAGDIGSISLAMLVFFTGLYMIYQFNAPLLLMMMVVYGADSTLTILYRVTIRENIGDPHRHHIYQKLVDRTNLSHLQVSGLYVFVQILISIVVYFNYSNTIEIQLYITSAIVFIFIGLYILLYKVLETRKELL